MKDLQFGKPTNVRQVLDQVMESIALFAVANANYKLKDPFSLTVMLCALFVVKRGH